MNLDTIPLAEELVQQLLSYISDQNDLEGASPIRVYLEVLESSLQAPEFSLSLINISTTPNSYYFSVAFLDVETGAHWEDHAHRKTGASHIILGITKPLTENEDEVVLRIDKHVMVEAVDENKMGGTLGDILSVFLAALTNGVRNQGSSRIASSLSCLWGPGGFDQAVAVAVRGAETTRLLGATVSRSTCVGASQELKQLPLDVGA
ncbi:unnamed protein product [Clonostachys solani]|uniref:Uncharacterized protein n=1 Tax=Clonostachys solani TaxID=160281 RepID=A0A9N9W1H7_9HYPO|nr:unnamed protein product [Clonostachys solani]